MTNLNRQCPEQQSLRTACTLRCSIAMIYTDSSIYIFKKWLLALARYIEDEIK